MATMEKLEGSKVKLTIEVPAADFEEAMQKAYHTAGKKYTVPGFRKGKAPRKVIENMYGPLVFFDDAFDLIYPAAYQAAVDAHGIEPVDRPDVSIDALPDGEKPLVFSLEVAVRPEVQLGQYKGIEVEKRAYNVTDEDVSAAIEMCIRDRGYAQYLIRNNQQAAALLFMDNRQWISFQHLQCLLGLRTAHGIDCLIRRAKTTIKLDVYKRQIIGCAA